MTFLITLSLFFEISLIIIISLILAYLGFLITRKLFSHEKLSENHTIASYIFNAFTVIYAVLLAFVVSSNWMNYEKSQENVYNESAYLSNFYRDTRFLPDSVRNVITGKLINYTKSVIDFDWKTITDGKTSPEADSALNDLWHTYIKIPVSGISNPYLYQVSLEKLNQISNYRRLRILDVKQTTPAVLWTVLIICGIISTGYTYYFTTKRRRTHFFLIATVVLVNILLFYLIYVLDHPYQGYSKISSEPFQLILNKFENIR